MTLRQFWLAMIAFCALVLFTLAIVDQARPAGLSTPAAASYRINVPIRSGAWYSGSATGIDDRIAVTNKHVAPILNGRVRLIHHLTGEQSGGFVFSIDGPADLALIYADKPLSYVRVSKDGINEKAEAEKFGYGGGIGKLSRIRCRYRHGSETITLSTPSISGDSGGGVFQNGHLVAVLWGSEDPTGRNGNATSVAENATQLYRMIGDYDSRHKTRFLQRVFPDCLPGDT